MFAPFLLLLQFDAPAKSNVEAFRKAVLARDAKYFERTFLPGYVQFAERQKIDRATALANLKRGFRKTSVASLGAKIVRVKAAPGGFVATVGFAGTMKGAFQGQPVTLRATWRDDQTWVKSKGRWGLRSTRTYNFKREAETD